MQRLLRSRAALLTECRNRMPAYMAPGGRDVGSASADRHHPTRRFRGSKFILYTHDELSSSQQKFDAIQALFLYNKALTKN
jgi:hypothetical protein